MRIVTRMALNVVRAGSPITRRTAFVLAALLAAFVVSPLVPMADAADRPNLVAIVTDDQGRWAMGAYGNEDISTPHMDRVAAEGALFTNAFVATPVCSPSRATYFTGQYPTQLGITDWIHPAEAADGLGLAAATWPQALAEHGYRTALVGKWHLGMLPQFHPQRLGFDHFMGFLAGGTRPMNPTFEVDGREQQMVGPCPDLLTDDAIRFIEENRERPFALCLHFRAPHLPYGPVPAVDSTQYEGLDPEVPRPAGGEIAQIKKWTVDYYASISSVDRNIGRVLATLDRLELSHNTMVVFTSDHGYNNGRHGVDTKGNGHWIAGGVRGPKRPNMWETSIRVPLCIRWPAVVSPGTVIDDVVSNLDMYRSVLGALDVPLPEDCRADGLDFSPRLRGEPIEGREVLFGQYDLHNNGLAYLRMIRTERYKLVRHFKANLMDELYDLHADPDETRNLLQRRDTGPQIDQLLLDLTDRLTRWQESIDDPLLESNY